MGSDGQPSVYLSAISHSLGAKVALPELNDPEVRERLDTLHEQGLRHCRVSAKPPVTLATESACATLDRANRSDVDTIVYCSDTPPHVGRSRDLWDFQLSIDHPASPGIVVGGSACGNLGPGLAIASSQVRTEGSTVLLVTTDRLTAGTRYLANGETVLSDGAASCLVGPRPEGPSFALRGLASSVRADAEQSSKSLAVAQVTARTIGHARSRAVDPPSAHNIKLLLTGHYGRAPRAFLAMSAGVAPEHVHHPRLADVGHCFSADVLIGLADLLQSDTVANGELVMLLTASPRSWSVAIVERVEGS
ncbi:hypothetical protein [Streptomyces sp. NPDC056661]|uniref:hypothetical protein n=1 Tax=Streptomyces sp. NPDC056661 TaxID=3345898 RepID=UPI0036C49431